MIRIHAHTHRAPFARSPLSVFDLLIRLLSIKVKKNMQFSLALIASVLAVAAVAAPAPAPAKVVQVTSATEPGYIRPQNRLYEGVPHRSVAALAPVVAPAVGGGCQAGATACSKDRKQLGACAVNTWVFQPVVAGSQCIVLNGVAQQSLIRHQQALAPKTTPTITGKASTDSSPKADEPAFGSTKCTSNDTQIAVYINGAWTNFPTPASTKCGVVNGVAMVVAA
ncbi:hypothetical protein BC828DRAFT_103832 [Blastocladiella britannica]|nr:hypothetical protein BC828DRAFT_103832 [Blastocladiella britannica]